MPVHKVLKADLVLLVLLDRQAELVLLDGLDLLDRQEPLEAQDLLVLKVLLVLVVELEEQELLV